VPDFQHEIIIMSPSATFASLEGSCLSDYISVDGESVELILEGKCSKDDAQYLLADMELHNLSINSLFVHGSFLKYVSEEQQVEMFKRVLHLQHLSFASVTVSAEALISLLDNSLHLEKIRFDRILIHCCLSERSRVTERFCDAMSKLSWLEDLHMSLGHFSTLTDNVEITSLFGGMADDNLGPLVQAISKIETLSSVYLGSDNRIHRTTMDPSVLTALALTVDELTIRNIGLSPLHFLCFDSPSIKLLNLIQVGLGDTGARILAQNIRREHRKTSLKNLYLPGNGITDTGGVAIVDALRSKSSVQKQLTVLDLRDNRIGEATVSELAGWLGTTRCGLAFLDLSCNSLGDQCGVTLASALLQNNSLEQLFLFKCGLGENTYETLAHSLSFNTSLIHLNLYENTINDESVEVLVECIKHRNSTLESLEIKPSSLESSSRSSSKGLERTLRFFLKLNRDFRGGKHFLQTASDAEYVNDAISKASSQADVNALFYFLRARPLLFCQSTPLESKVMASGAKICAPAATNLVAANKLPKLRAQTFCNPQA
jgi:Ran GTPase-activating protein (RanGAP) involved in mRNA processing and transport